MSAIMSGHETFTEQILQSEVLLDSLEDRQLQEILPALSITLDIVNSYRVLINFFGINKVFPHLIHKNNFMIDCNTKKYKRNIFYYCLHFTHF